MSDHPLEEALEIMGLGIASWKSDGAVTHCPFWWKHEGNADNKPSLSVSIKQSNVEKGLSPWVYKCHACKEGGTIVVLAKRMVRWESITEEVAERVEALEKSDSDPWAVRVGSQRTPGSEKWRKRAKTSVNWKSIPKYVIDRGVTVETANKWGLGYDKEWGRLVFPVRGITGQVVGIVGRSMDPDADAKYLTYPGFKKSAHLYGEHLLYEPCQDRHVVVVEGYLDVLIPWQMKVPYIMNAIMGVDMSEKQAQTLTVFADRITLMYDNDKAGQEGAGAAATLLSRADESVPVSVVRRWPDGKKDPKELTYQEFVETVEGASPA